MNEPKGTMKASPDQNMLSRRLVERQALRDAVDGRYQVNILAIFKEAWGKVKSPVPGYGFKLQIWLGVFMLLVTSLLLSAVTSQIVFDGVFWKDVSSIVQSLLSLLVLSPIAIGIVMIAVRSARGAESKLKQVFQYYPLIGKIFLASIIIELITSFIPTSFIKAFAAFGKAHPEKGAVVTTLLTLGILLFVLMAIYFTVTYSLALVLLVDRKLGVWTAIKTSRQTLHHRWLKVLGLYFLSGLLLAIGVASAVLSVMLKDTHSLVNLAFSILTFSLIWTLPLMMAIVGILYREVFQTQAD